MGLYEISRTCQEGGAVPAQTPERVARVLPKVSQAIRVSAFHTLITR